MSLSYINHKGKNILYIDYTNCKTVQDTLDILDQVREEFLKSPDKILALNNYEGVTESKAYMIRANQYAKEIFNMKTSKNAAIGISGIKKILLIIYNVLVHDKVMQFKTKEEALDYLVK